MQGNGGTDCGNHATGEVMVGSFMMATSNFCAFQIDGTDPHLPYLLPIIHKRLQGEGASGPEPSEEVRAILAGLLGTALDVGTADDILPHADEVAASLKALVLDRHPEAKLIGCTGVEKLAATAPKIFSHVAANLVGCLCKATGHQQRKVRIAAVRALGLALVHSPSQEFTSSAIVLAQRFFDQAPEVRMQVARSAADLGTKWTYR